MFWTEPECIEGKQKQQTNVARARERERARKKTLLTAMLRKDERVFVRSYFFNQLNTCLHFWVFFFHAFSCITKSANNLIEMIFIVVYEYTVLIYGLFHRSTREGGGRAKAHEIGWKSLLPCSWKLITFRSFVIRKWLQISTTTKVK